MASQYFIQTDGQESGPFGFRDLVAFVREGKLVHSDQVRFSWTKEWQRADSLVGLFHMAQKAPQELAQHDAPVTAPVVDEPIPALPDDQAVTAKDRPGWILRLMDAGGFRKKRPAQIPILGATPSHTAAACDAPAGDSPYTNQAGSDRPAASRANAGRPNEELPAEIAAFFSHDADGHEDRWSSAVDDALAAVTARGAGRSAKVRSSRIWKMFGSLAGVIPRGDEGQSLMRNGFRIVCAIACANLVAWAVDSWSVEEALRFPSRDAQVSGLHHFPIIGTCGSGEYLFLMFDLMLAAGVAAWFTAGWLESRAE